MYILQAHHKCFSMSGHAFPAIDSPEKGVIFRHVEKKLTSKGCRSSFSQA